MIKTEGKVRLCLIHICAFFFLKRRKSIRPVRLYCILEGSFSSQQLSVVLNHLQAARHRCSKGLHVYFGEKLVYFVELITPQSITVLSALESTCAFNLSIHGRISLANSQRKPGSQCCPVTDYLTLPWRNKHQRNHLGATDFIHLSSHPQCFKLYMQLEYVGTYSLRLRRKSYCTPFFFMVVELGMHTQGI